MDIIVVDDDPISRLKLIALLKDFGHEPRPCADGQEAWEEYDRQPTRMIISDWKMPRIDGLELCYKIRQRPQTEYCYFLLVTAEEEDALGYDLSIGIDVDDFLVKPIQFQGLGRRLRVAERILGFTTAIRQLQALLPICSYCHRIRDDEEDGRWEEMEEFVSSHTGSHFSHGACPDCQRMAAQAMRG